jgi:MazG family protein
MNGAADEIEALLALVRTLRDPQSGCPWDRTQSFASIAPYTIEEAYEVADAIARSDLERLRDELGDLLFQIVFHARLAEELGRFDFAAVVRAISDKLVRRHPHVFAEPAPVELAQLHVSWEAQKAAERVAQGARATLADVPRAGWRARRSSGGARDGSDLIGSGPSRCAPRSMRSSRSWIRRWATGSVRG